MAKDKTKKTAMLTLPVAFGNASIGDKIASITIKIGRNNISISQADKNLVGRRLVGHILARPEGAGASQPGFLGDEGDTVLKGIFDVNSISVTTKAIGCSLSFAIKSIKVEDLAHFAKRQGQIVVDEILAIDDDAGEKEEGDEE